MPPSARRVASRFLLAADPPITEAYYLKLVGLAQKDELLDALPRLQRSKRSILDPDQPMSVSELWEYLAGFDVAPVEIEALKRVPLPKALRAPKGMDYTEFSRAVGKSVMLGVSLEELAKYAPHLKAWAKAIETLPRPAADLYHTEVKKLRLVEARGTEDASWDVGGVLKLSLKAVTPDPKVYRFYLIHELGHALQEKSGLSVTAWDENPYGNPPFVSDYAEVNAMEDFAETFRAFVMEPAHLKKIAPAKYADMARRVA